MGYISPGGEGPYWLATEIVSIPYEKVMISDNEAKTSSASPFPLRHDLAGLESIYDSQPATCFHLRQEDRMVYLINGLTFAMMLFVLSSGLNIMLGFSGV